MVTMTDLFCGAGGSSTGAIQIPGVQVLMAANHARKAINTHQANHPTADHDCADISQVMPGRYPRTDILWASPECTNHSKAKGKKRGHGEFNGGLLATDGTDEVVIRSRATMWDVFRFAEHHSYRYIIVENVPDVRWWGPEDMPGATFDAWLGSMRSWNYQHRIVYLDSAHAQALGGGSRSRRPRMYIVLWMKGERTPDFEKWLRPWGECTQHGQVQLVQSWKYTKMSSPERPWGVYGVKTGQYVYRCPSVQCRNQIVEPDVRTAAEAIEWNRPAPLIGGRKRPLVENTMRRIRKGYERYGVAAGHPEKTGVMMLPPFLVELRGGGSATRPITQPMSTVTAGGNHHFLVTVPNMLVPYYGNGRASLASGLMPTITVKDRHSLLVGGQVSSVEECGYRMVYPSEYARAMEFPDKYVYVGEEAGKPPTNEQWVEMIGNAVTPNVSRDLVAMVAEAATGEDIERFTPSGLLAAAA